MVGFLIPILLSRHSLIYLHHMNLLSVENLSKNYDEKTLFEGISFGIDEGQKVALVAKNGTGKSTLMKILAGQEVPDRGKVTLRKGIRVSYLDQNPVFPPLSTVFESAFHSDLPILKVVREYERCLAEYEMNKGHQPQTPNFKLQTELQTAMARMDESNAWDYESRIKQVLSTFRIHNFNQKIKELSGGQIKRLALAHALIDQPDFLLLDEPTNHLDIDMVEWLEDFLSQSSMTLLLVTHDRYFLDNLCDEIIEIENGNLYSYQGNYSYFVEKKAEREFNESREMDKSRNLMRKELEWVRRMPRARRTKSKARLEAFDDLKEKVGGKKKEETLSLDIKMNRIGGKVIEMKKVYKGYGDLKILKGFDYTFKTGERIGIVGQNGSGKTTFLNLITGLEPADSGKINVGDTVIFGYYSQQGIKLKEDKRVIEVVKEIADVITTADGTKVPASSFLTRFQFAPEMQYTFVSKLSGGEKRRLYLLTVLIKNPNFLILDEPTNDLDLITLNILEEFLLNYKGCLLVVSHDRYFMNKLVDHLFVFEGDGKVGDFNGTYSEWRDKKEAQEKAEEQKQKNEKSAVKIAEKKAAEKKKLSFKEKFELEQLEKDMASLEAEKKELNEKLNSGLGGNEELIQWSKRYGEVINLLDEKSFRWLELSEQI
jgi:ATP-binding cassette subfamily F protein uup